MGGRMVCSAAPEADQVAGCSAAEDPGDHLTEAERLQDRHASAQVVHRGTEPGLRPKTLRLLEQAGTDPSGKRRDLVVQMDTQFSLGYLKPFQGFELGSSDRISGTPGGGGSLGFVDPTWESAMPTA
jgi:hypothetical protein